jgi:hypothetical protein
MKKKVKKYAEGGLSGIADTANSLMGEVDGMANSIKYGSGAGSDLGSGLGFNKIVKADPSTIFDPTMSRPGRLDSTSSTTTADMGPKSFDAGAGFKALSGMLSGQKTFKKGGKVSSASKRADGIAIRGKTRA